MKIKGILTAILLLLVGIFTSANAEVWLPITAENGKVSEVEIDTIDIDSNIATYSLKRKDANYEYIAKMKINLDNKTFAVVNNTAYSNGKQVSFKDNSDKLSYSAIKNGTLADSVYKMLIIAKESPALDVKLKTWNKYFKRQQRLVQGSWHPNNVDGYEPPHNAIAYVTVVLDKYGNILSRTYQNNTNTDPIYSRFNENLEQEINKIFIKNSKFEPLPYEFKGDKIIVVMKFTYSFDRNAKSEKISWEETGIGYLGFGKNKSNWVIVGKAIYVIVALPAAISCALFHINVYDWL